MRILSKTMSKDTVNPWRRCLGTYMDMENNELELPDGTILPLEKVEFIDPSVYPNASWRRRPPVKGDAPPQKEVILLEPEPLEKVQLAIAQSFKGGFASKLQGKRNAVQVDPKLSPIAVKILSYLDSQTQDFLQRHTSPKLEEMKLFQQFLLEPVKDDSPLKGFSGR